MKELKQYITEGSGFKFNRYQISAMNKVLDAVTVKFNLTSRSKIKDIKSYIKKSQGGSPRLVIEYKDPKYGKKVLDGLIMIFDTGINAAPAIDKLTNDGYECRLKSFEYNDKTNTTILKYELQSFGINSRWDFIWGELEFEFNGDCVNPEVSPVKFDDKKYIKFMKDYLPKKVEYFQQYKWDDEILYCEASPVKKDQIDIHIQLEVGKGYGDNHLHKADYDFTWSNSYYNCNKQLYDRDREAQIVRKFIDGLCEFMGYNNCPQHIKVHIEQELD